MGRQKRIWRMAGSGTLLVLALAVLLSLLLPNVTLTQRPREFAESTGYAPVPVSHASLPIELPLDALGQHLTRELEASLAEGREGKDFQVWLNGAVRLKGNGHAVQMTAPLRFKSKSGPDTKGELVVYTRIGADMASDWRPKVNVRSIFDWTKKPKIRFLSIKIRVSGVVGRAIQKKLGEFDADLRRKIEAALNLKPRAENWWQGLHQPRLLSDSPPVWLVVAPEQFYFQPLSGDDDVLRFMFGVRARLSTTIARRPDPAPPVPLPPLRPATVDDEGFAVFLPVLADYQGLAAEMQRKLAGQEIKLERGAITPIGFVLYTSGRRLVVGVDFKSDAPGIWLDTRGTVYFTGEPRFDPQTRILRVENFQFTRRLNNPLVSTASWVLQDSLRQQMQQRLVWDMSARLEETASDLSDLLNRPLDDDLRLDGHVDYLNLTRVECRTEGIHIGLEARGWLKVTLTAAGMGSG